MKGIENLSAGAYYNIVFDGGVSLYFFEADTAKCHSVVKSNIIAYLRCFAYHNTHAVIYEKSFAYDCSGMDLYAGEKSAEVRYEPSEKKNFFVQNQCAVR